MKKSDIGVIGLAVMGENLAMNMESQGFKVSVYNREEEWTRDLIQKRGKEKNIHPTFSYKELVQSLQKPRKIMLMIQAGKPVDEVIEQLMPLLEKGDIILDGGNSNFEDTGKRVKRVEKEGLYYIGVGVSGGEEGALKGPSLMPGGSVEAWPFVKPILQKIAAKVETKEQPCCQWIGPEGSGHFVKMVHNGIEYGDIQLICEAYQVMKDGLAMEAEEISQVFAQWNQGELNSYLIEITQEILAFKDQDGSPLVDRILDTAGQKGTGKWTVTSALTEGVPLTLIADAVFSRFLSAQKEERVVASKILKGPEKRVDLEKQQVINALEKALLASKIISYAQGFSLMQSAASHYGWHLNYSAIASVWQGGCIIRSGFLKDIQKAFDENNLLLNLMLSPYFATILEKAQAGWRQTCVLGIEKGIPLSAMTSALAYYDGYRCERLPANLLQAQRDYFGAHTYERIDAPRGKFFHTNWTGEGGERTSTTYTK